MAYAALRGRILDGQLAPGSRLAQDELAAGLGMSITPLREAIRQLASEGLVAVVAHRDVRVSTASASEASDLLETRLALEPSATRLAAARRDDEDLARMAEAAGRLVPVTREGGEHAVAAHRDFHRAVYLASRNDVMIRMLDDLWDKSDRYRRLGLALPGGDEPRIDDLQEHHELLALVRAGDEDGAEGLARRHVAHSLSASVPEALAHDDPQTR
ncbi:GntR family transcriptional regulator [Microbacterium tumbae]